jgi:DNA-binding response OmpR family regulator
MAKKVLVVDDEPSVRKVIEHALRHEGLEVRTAGNGAECLQAVEAEPPDLILLDVNMPVMDGFQTLRVLRENAATKHLPVIILTARGDDADVSQAWTTGVDLYLMKPLALDDLLVAVRRSLDVLGTDSAEDTSPGEPPPS